MKLKMAAVLTLVVATVSATPKKLTGVYLQWGYNREVYTRSTIRFWKEGEYDFKVHNVKAHDKPDFDGFVDTPLDVTIPQNSFRIGFYLNEQKTHAIEINFDHAKYVVTDGQRIPLTGQIDGKQLPADTTINFSFLEFEHTNGANFYHINYVKQSQLWRNKKHMKATALFKIGAGIVVPRTDVHLFGVRKDNKYQVSGYVVSAEMGSRFYPLKNLFLEANIKTGFAHYLRVRTMDGGLARHGFGYFEVIGLLGYDILWGKAKNARPLGTTDSR